MVFSMVISIFQILESNHSSLESSRGRVVKALDLKSNGVSPRRFESCRLRITFRKYGFRSIHLYQIYYDHVSLFLEILINLSESQVLVAWIALTMPMGTLGIDTNLEEHLLDHGAQRILAQNMPKGDISRYDIHTRRKIMHEK